MEQQVRFLTDDKDKAQAFAEASNIDVGKIPEFLRGLTPVVLRADTRVTNHAFRDGAADGFQSVLQAGTAVLVDEHGMPRVRCGCGNPLASPRTAKGSPVHKGDPWSGYQVNQVVVIEPTTHVINNLVIVNIADNTWIERKRGRRRAGPDPEGTARLRPVRRHPGRARQPAGVRVRRPLPAEPALTGLTGLTERPRGTGSRGDGLPARPAGRAEPARREPAAEAGRAVEPVHPAAATGAAAAAAAVRRSRGPPGRPAAAGPR